MLLTALSRRRLRLIQPHLLRLRHCVIGSAYLARTVRIDHENLQAHFNGLRAKALLGQSGL